MVNENKNSGPRVNNAIRVPQVRLIDGSGKQVGIISTREAIQLASDDGLDLVEINPKVSPPVCKIMDYGKFKYEQKKKEKEIAKVQKENTLGFKEVSVRPTTVDHDLQIKAENYVQRWLAEGNKVKISVMFSGREMQHPEFGKEVIEKMFEFLQPNSYTVDEKLTTSEKQMSVVIVPVITTVSNSVAKAI